MIDYAPGDPSAITTGENKTTPIHLAVSGCDFSHSDIYICILIKAYNGHFEVLQDLVYKYQMFLDYKDDKGRTPLDLAAFRGHR